MSSDIFIRLPTKNPLLAGFWFTLLNVFLTTATDIIPHALNKARGRISSP